MTEHGYRGRQAVGSTPEKAAGSRMPEPWAVGESLESLGERRRNMAVAHGMNHGGGKLALISLFPTRALRDGRPMPGGSVAPIRGLRNSPYVG